MQNKYEKIRDEQGLVAAREYMRAIRSQVKKKPGGYLAKLKQEGRIEELRAISERGVQKRRENYAAKIKATEALAVEDEFEIEDLTADEDFTQSES